VSSHLSLEVPAAAAAVPGARVAVTELCERLGLGGELTERIRLAATEACTNCVLHAYDGEGPRATFALDVHVDEDALLLVVRDFGHGLLGARPGRLDTLHLGMRLIEELADSSTVSSSPGHGTRVAMRFALPEKLSEL
jgi:anti-sigma regulatory factor (Ser/Thr protein kinase)